MPGPGSGPGDIRPGDIRPADVRCPVDARRARGRRTPARAASATGPNTWHRVVAASRQRLATQQPTEGQQTTDDATVPPQSGQGIGATGRLKPAAARVPRRPAGAVQPDQRRESPRERPTDRLVGGPGQGGKSPGGDRRGEHKVDECHQDHQDPRVPGHAHPKRADRGDRPERTVPKAESSDRPRSADVAVAASGNARTRTAVPGGSRGSRDRVCSRRRRRTRLRTTALPTRRPTTKPARGGLSTSVCMLWTTIDPARIRRPDRPRMAWSVFVRTREPRGSMAGRRQARWFRRQAESSLRPLRRRPDRMARPARVRIRSRNPWVRARRRLFGWKVRLLT